jgi:hypothetical protein
MFVDVYSVYRADMDCSSSATPRSGGSLIAAHHSVTGFKDRFDLELTNERVWFEISILDGFSVLNGNHNFSHNTDTKTIEEYLNSLEDILKPRSFLVLILGHFSLSGYDWFTGFHQANSHYYS